jgi:hypothetical protein
MTTAIAPVAPEIMPGLPPKIEVTKPIVNAAYSPVRGESPAIRAKATASGINASATVRPERISFL